MELKFRVFEHSIYPEFNHMVTDRTTTARVIKDYLLKSKSQDSGWQPHCNDTKELHSIMICIGKIGDEEVYTGDIFEYNYFDITGNVRSSFGYIDYNGDEYSYMLKTKIHGYIGIDRIISTVITNIHQNPELINK